MAGQSCGGGAGQQQALLDLFTQVNGEIQERQEDMMPFCAVNMAWLEHRRAERSPSRTQAGGWHSGEQCFSLPTLPPRKDHSAPRPQQKKSMPQTIAYLFTDGM